MKKYQKRKKLNCTKSEIIENNYKIGRSLFFVLAVLSIIIVIMTNLTINNIVKKRLTDETSFLVKQQAQLISQSIDNELKNVSVIAGMVEQGLSFVKESDQKMLESYVEINRLCMLAYADEEGNVTTYYGEEIGNISDREYFRDIISTKKKGVCQYLATTASDGEPRLIFSAPVKQEDKVIGVVFLSKEISVIQNSFFQQSLFNNKEGSMLVDGNGDILVKNSRAQKIYGNADSVYDIYKKYGKKLTTLSSGTSGSSFLGQGNEVVLASAAIGYNDWNLVCIIDSKDAKEEYASNLIEIKHLIMIATTCFVLAILYSIIRDYIQIKKYQNEYEDKKSQYERVVDLLMKAKSVICEYDIVENQMVTNDRFTEIWGCELKDNMFDHLEEYKSAHPEFDFDGLYRELCYAIENKVTTSFESFYSKNKYSYKSMSITMMPVIGTQEKVIKVLGVIRENSMEHFQLTEKVDMMDQIPGGTYRYILSKPISLVYVGEKLQKMLGYSGEELKTIVGNRFSNIVSENDRDRYREFIKEAALSPGVRSCQYEIDCKSGNNIVVLDTMESIRKESGTMYGYSVIVDVSEYVKRQNIVHQELKQLEIKLENLRINNATSQMQPHFLYNALSSIREIVMEDPQYASDLLYDFTIYLRACIRTMQRSDLILISQEISNIRAYINIEKMRMGDRLQVVYELYSENFKVAPLSIQPLVENAIRHGIFKRGTQGGKVIIKTETLEDYNRIVVEDNGVGFDYQKVRDEVEKGLRESIGLDNVMFRLTKKQNARVVINSKIGEGTKVVIWLPREKD